MRAPTPGLPTSGSCKSLGSRLLLVVVREVLGKQCANVGSSLGGTGPPEKTLWACYRGRKTGTGPGQAEEEKPQRKVAFPHLTPAHPPAGHPYRSYTIAHSASVNPRRAERPQLTCFHKETETADAQKGRLLREVPRWAPRRGSVYQQCLALLVRVCMDSDGALAASPAGEACGSGSFVPFMDICKIIKKPTFKSYNL